LAIPNHAQQSNCELSIGSISFDIRPKNSRSGSLESSNDVDSAYILTAHPVRGGPCIKSKRDGARRVQPKLCVPSHALARVRDGLAGWACRIRTGESVRELSDCNSVTTSPEVAAVPRGGDPSRASCVIRSSGQDFSGRQFALDFSRKQSSMGSRTPSLTGFKDGFGPSFHPVARTPVATTTRASRGGCVTVERSQR
jgi:hypothetical protein